MIKSSFNVRVEKYIFCLIAAALAIKFILFLYIACVDPVSIMQNDSYGYLVDASAWGHYFTVPSEGLRHSLYRTPGYPLFLAILHVGLNLPLLGIIFLQVVLNIFTAIVVFKITSLTGRRTGLLSAAIVLLDLPLTIYSGMVLTESLYVFVLSLFLYAFVKYINGRRFSRLVVAALLLGASVYIRPVSYFLGFAMAGFVLYLWGIKKVLTGIVHAMAVLVFVYGFLGIWQYHNLKTHGAFVLTNIDNATIHEFGVIGRYARETDPKFRAMPPPLYYTVSIGRNFLDLMANPCSMKYLHSKAWKIFGAGFGYLFVVFWWLGLIAGVRQCKADAVGQFLILILLYFISVTLVSTGWAVTPRYRVPMVPAIAILSARGWVALLCWRAKQELLTDPKEQPRLVS